MPGCPGTWPREYFVAKLQAELGLWKEMRQALFPCANPLPPPRTDPCLLNVQGLQRWAAAVCTRTVSASFCSTPEDARVPSVLVWDPIFFLWRQLGYVWVEQG